MSEARKEDRTDGMSKGKIRLDSTPFSFPFVSLDSELLLLPLFFVLCSAAQIQQHGRELRGDDWSE